MKIRRTGQLIDNARAYCWRIELHRCNVRYSIEEQGKVSTFHACLLADYDESENRIRAFVGLPLKTTSFKLRQHGGVGQSDSGLQTVIVGEALRLPVTSRADIERMYPNLVKYIYNPIEDQLLQPDSE